jgi:hypothetical protein
MALSVIPGRQVSIEPGIHGATRREEKWIFELASELVIGPTGRPDPLDAPPE